MEPQEPTLDESIKQVMQTLPPVIRDYLSKGKYTAVARELMAKYSLHIDQSGILEREIMLLLMGIENPTEFTQALVEEAKIDKQVVDKIVQDVNTQIFIPLKAEEMKSKGNGSERPAVQKTPAVLPQQSATNEKLLENHEEPSMALREANDLASMGINKIPFSPKKIVPLPANLPGTIQPLKQKPISSIPPVPAKPYSVDPYREPIE